MQEYKEDDFLMISGIQHYVFCRRQWAMIHIEQQWGENYFTVDGDIKHQRVDNNEIHEKRNHVISIRALPIKSMVLGITGKCDVVEFHEDNNGINLADYEGKYKVIPVEYKRGKPKDNNSDRLQLLAQAYCLEEMLSTKILHGYLFYFETRRREEVIFDDKLRAELNAMVGEMHHYMKKGHTPKVKKTKKCSSCSLKDICLPELYDRIDIEFYIQGRIEE